MHPHELQALRRLLFFSVDEAAARLRMEIDSAPVAIDELRRVAADRAKPVVDLTAEPAKPDLFG